MPDLEIEDLQIGFVAAMLTEKRERVRKRKWERVWFEREGERERVWQWNGHWEKPSAVGNLPKVSTQILLFKPNILSQSLRKVWNF